MTMNIGELDKLWVRFKTSVAFGGMPDTHLPVGVEPDDYNEERILIWDEIDALCDAGPTATLMKTAAALRSGDVAYERESVPFENGMELAECLLADTFRGDAESTITEEMRRAAVSTITDVLRAAVENHPGDGLEGRMYQDVFDAWVRDFCTKEKLAAE